MFIQNLTSTDEHVNSPQCVNVYNFFKFSFQKRLGNVYSKFDFHNVLMFIVVRVIPILPIPSVSTLLLKSLPFYTNCQEFLRPSGTPLGFPWDFPVNLKLLIWHFQIAPFHSIITNSKTQELPSDIELFIWHLRKT